MQMIKVENLSKQYTIGAATHNTLRDAVGGFFRRGATTEAQTFNALDGVSFNANEGETLGIIGSNGAGKSTLLKILSRITKPTTGTAEIRGRVGSLLEVGTGFHNELSGRENIYLNGAILGMKKAEIERKFAEIVEFSEIEKFLDTPVKHYSSGMYMRLAFSIAAHLEPEVLIIDEVLAVGDINFQRKCLGKMDEVSRSGRTVLFVSHNLGSLAQICKTGLLLHKGRLISQGPIAGVINEYLAFAQTEKQFKLDELDSRKEMQITEASISNSGGHVTSEVAHDEDFFLDFRVSIQRLVPGALYCVALLNRNKERVFSEIKPVDEFAPLNDSLRLRYTVPKGFIAPNNYSFHISIFFPNGEFIDKLSDVCPFSVVDIGSELSIYRDYGFVQARSEWRIIED